jgi:hypothetical protein
MSSKEIRLFFGRVDSADEEDQLTFRDCIVRVGKFYPATTDQLWSCRNSKYLRSQNLIIEHTEPHDTLLLPSDPDSQRGSSVPKHFQELGNT